MKCEHFKKKYTIKLILTNRQDIYFPKYIPQIKETCFDCGKYIRFAPQTPELIEEINTKLKGIPL